MAVEEHGKSYRNQNTERICGSVIVNARIEVGEHVVIGSEVCVIPVDVGEVDTPAPTLNAGSDYGQLRLVTTTTADP